MRILPAALALVTALPAQPTTPADIAVQQGTDAGSGISYALISIGGRRVSPGETSAAPRLTAQCTRNAVGKLRFELLADAGDVPDLRFVPPWKPISENDLFPPSLPKVTVTMEFLGYTRVKPVKRQWTGIDGLPAEWKYSTPGLASANMEEIAYYMQYLKALPTLRLTFVSKPGKPPVTLEFDTQRWQQRVKAEPLCAASGL